MYTEIHRERHSERHTETQRHTEKRSHSDSGEKESGRDEDKKRRTERWFAQHMLACKQQSPSSIYN